MQTSQTLIDKAKQLCQGSRRELARRLGEDASFLGRIERGEAPMPPGLAIRLAADTGDNPIDATLTAVLDQEHDDTKRAAIAKALASAGWRRR